MISNVSSSSSIPHTTDAPNKKQSLSSGKPIVLPSRILSLIWAFRPGCSYLSHARVCKNWRASIEAYLKLERNSQDLMIATIGRILLTPSITTINNLEEANKIFSSNSYPLAHGWKVVLRLQQDINDMSTGLIINSEGSRYHLTYFEDNFFKLSDSHFATFWRQRNKGVLRFYKVEGSEKIIYEKAISIGKFNRSWQWKDHIFVMTRERIRCISLQNKYKMKTVFHMAVSGTCISAYHSDMCVFGLRNSLYAYKYDEKEQKFKLLWDKATLWTNSGYILYEICCNNRYVVVKGGSNLNWGEDNFSQVFDSLTGSPLLKIPNRDCRNKILFGEFLSGMSYIHYIPTGFKFNLPALDYKLPSSPLNIFFNKDSEEIVIRNRHLGLQNPPIIIRKHTLVSKVESNH